jgi:hypothetical protein
MANEWRHSTGQKIERLYAWVAEEADGGEGLCSMPLGDIQMPMIGADRARIESMRDYAQRIASILGIPIRLVEFSTRTVLEDSAGPRH